MSDEALALAQAAEALAGTPFRFRGRDRATGLDCVGLVLAALADIGRKPAQLGGYAMRQLRPERHFQVALDCGFEEVWQRLKPGDLVLAEPAPALVHLAIFTGPRGFAHAHAGLRRVTLTPPPFPWPITRQWRLSAD